MGIFLTLEEVTWNMTAAYKSMYWFFGFNLPKKKKNKKIQMKKSHQNQKTPTTKLNFFFWKVRMESKLLKNEMKGVKLRSY